MFFDITKQQWKFVTREYIKEKALKSDKLEILHMAA